VNNSVMMTFMRNSQNVEVLLEISSAQVFDNMQKKWIYLFSKFNHASEVPNMYRLVLYVLTKSLVD
jgi:hypothetical protein